MISLRYAQLQAFDKIGYATPADWMPGDSYALPAPQTLKAATQRLDEDKKGAYYCLDWYICFTKGSQATTKAGTAGTSVVSASEIGTIKIWLT